MQKYYILYKTEYLFGGRMDDFIYNSEIKEKTEKDRQKELIKSILRTKMELNISIKNYEFAEDDLIDYYLYQIKANQSKLDYLIKKAKENKIAFNVIDKLRNEA